MKAYLLSIAAGLLVGVVYSLLGVRSPAPPMIALLGLLGILLGEQIVPVIGKAITKRDVAEFVMTQSREHLLGQLPSFKPDAGSASAKADA